jgi:predicted TIM-barrel fold metal-dependent hydrolase
MRLGIIFLTNAAKNWIRFYKTDFKRKGNSMIIDIHVHPFCKEATVKPNMEEAIKRQTEAFKDPARADAFAQIFTAMFTQRSIKDTLKEMDDNGIDKACIVAMDLTTHFGVELVTNEDVGRLASEHPDRFIPFASVDPNMGRAAVDKLIYAVQELGCRGVKLVPPVQHVDLSDPRHDRLWQTALDLGILVWTHCAHQRAHPDSDARLGHPMLIEPVALKFPDLKIVLGHCGFPWVWEAWSLVLRHPNVYVDISAFSNLYEHFPWDAYSKCGAEDKILFATDNPLFSFQETLDSLNAVGLSDEFKRKVLGDNAAHLLQLY